MDEKKRFDSSYNRRCNRISACSKPFLYCESQLSPFLRPRTIILVRSLNFSSTWVITYTSFHQVGYPEETPRFFFFFWRGFDPEHRPPLLLPAYYLPPYPTQLPLRSECQRAQKGHITHQDLSILHLSPTPTKLWDQNTNKKPAPNLVSCYCFLCSHSDSESVIPTFTSTSTPTAAALNH